jgi:GNAT superfamily N-acetyltransferase
MAELGYPISHQDMRNRFALATSSDCDELFVAEDGDQVVGLIGVQVAEFMHRAARYGRITALVVSSSQRRKGVGSALLERAEGWLWQRGIADLHVDAGWQRAEEGHRFYKALGFTATGVRLTRRLDL